MGLYLVLLFITINIALAKYDAYRISKNIRIRHAINALIYVGLILLFYNSLTVWKFVGLLLIRIPVFNTALNLFRGLPAIYLSKSTTSIVDKLMNNIIRKVGYWTYNFIIFVVSIILIIWA